MQKSKTKRYCQLPKVSTVSGRSSSITNAFFNAIIPVHVPTPEDELEALAVLEMSPEEICCAYCGDSHTERDHLRPIIREKKPTGYITEIANLVPACGKCNQSKGGYHWRDCMLGSAPRSPKTRGVADLDRKVMLLGGMNLGGAPFIDFDSVVEPQLWKEHKENWQDVLGLLAKSQTLAKEIRKLVEDATRRHPS
jgi:5-methylcytosine-specific restriction endonuclease McrA